MSDSSGRLNLFCKGNLMIIIGVLQSSTRECSRVWTAWARSCRAVAKQEHTQQQPFSSQSVRLLLQEVSLVIFPFSEIIIHVEPFNRNHFVVRNKYDESRY